MLNAKTISEFGSRNAIRNEHAFTPDMPALGVITSSDNHIAQLVPRRPTAAGVSLSGDGARPDCQPVVSHSCIASTKQFRSPIPLTRAETQRAQRKTPRGGTRPTAFDVIYTMEEMK